MYKIFIFILLFVLSTRLQAQEVSVLEKLYNRVYNRFIAPEKDSVKESTLLVLPALGYSPETKLTYGIQGNYSFYLDKKNNNTRPSNITSYIIFGGNQYKNIKLKTDLWTSDNDMHYFADIKLRDFFVRFYGVGNNTTLLNRDNLREKIFTSQAFAEKKLSSHWYAGLRAGFEQYHYTDTLAGGIYDREGFNVFEKGKLLYFGMQQSLDNRNNIFSSTRGYFFHANVSLAPQIFKGNNFTGTILNVDYRHFFSLKNNLVLGVNARTSNYFSKNTIPFYVMPQMGSDEIMRGYFQGRFRDHHYSATQIEVRYRFIPRLSVAAFTGLGEVYGTSPFSFNELKPNYGGGLRYFFDIKKSQCVRLDYGWGEKLPGEKRQGGFYFSLNEAF